MAFAKSLLMVLLVVPLASSTFTGRCPKPGSRLVLHGIGKNDDKLRPTVDLFNLLLGGVDNESNPGPLKQGRRSINWDAGIVPFDFPGDFFVKVVTRGLTVSNGDDVFAVSNPPVDENNTLVDDKFDGINKRAAEDFLTFSPERLFSPVNENKVTIEFSIPAKRDKALVRGFGAVFVDIDKKLQTQAVYFDKNDCVIAEEFVDKQRNGLSFLGVIFDSPIIARVEVHLGAAPIGGHKRGDFVVMDDFLYAEPQALTH